MRWGCGVTVSEAAGRAVGAALGALVMAVARPFAWAIGAFPSVNTRGEWED